MQAVNITTNIKIKVHFTFPALRATNLVTWKCHVDDSAKGRYNMILGWNLLTELELNLKFSEHVIKSYNTPFKGSKTYMVDLGTYILKYLNTDKITYEESLTDDYDKEV